MIFHKGPHTVTSDLKKCGGVFCICSLFSAVCGRFFFSSVDNDVFFVVCLFVCLFFNSCFLAVYVFSSVLSSGAIRAFHNVSV